MTLMEAAKAAMRKSLESGQPYVVCLKAHNGLPWYYIARLGDEPATASVLYTITPRGVTTP